MSPVGNNDNTSRTPRTSFDHPALPIDFPDFRIGIAEYDEGPTGCTVFLFPPGRGVADIRGGAPGVVNANVPWDYDGICFTGGSGLGLQAVSGVIDELFAQRDYAVARQPVVGGSVIFDFGARGRSNVYPDRELGRAAARDAKPGTFPLGARGAGRSATCGKASVGVEGAGQPETSGQGAAFRTFGGGHLAVFVVVNSMGVIVGRDGSVVRGNVDAATGERSVPTPEAMGRSWARREAMWRQSRDLQPPPATTLTLVVTDLAIDDGFMQQFARQVHGSMSRAIQPFNAPEDGDVLWAISLGQVDNDMGPMALAAAASELAWDAVLSSSVGLDDPGPVVGQHSPDQ